MRWRMRLCKSNTPQVAGYLTLAAVAKCLQAVTWFVARGNQIFRIEKAARYCGSFFVCIYSQIKSLMAQRQSLLERKQAWADSAPEHGQDTKSVRDLMDSYEEQLKELDQQIAQETARKNSEQLKKHSLQKRRRNRKRSRRWSRRKRRSEEKKGEMQAFQRLDAEIIIDSDFRIPYNKTQ